MSDALDELAGALGDGGVLRADDDLHRFVVDARSHAEGRALAVARPRDVEGVRAVLAWARRHGVRLVPQGANSGLVGASIPDGGGAMVVLSTERLTGVLDVDPLDRTARVSAGVRLSALNDAAAPFGLCLPIDLGADPSLGGMAATNTGGARLLRYGDVRHNTLAVEVVVPDDACSVLRLGRGLRKDNTGLDLKHAFVGTGGELGVITEVTVSLHPVPRARAAAMVALADEGAAVALVTRLEASVPELLASFELISAEALRRTLDHSGLRSPFDEVPPFAALVELVSSDPEAPLVERLAEELAEADLIDARLGPPEDWWAIRHRVTESMRAAGAVVAFDVSVRRPLYGVLRARTSARLTERAPGAVLCDFGHVGDGGVHLNVLFPHGVTAPTAEQVVDLRTDVYDVVDALGGSFSAEHGVGPTNARWAARYADPVVAATFDALKARFDPLGVLGRLSG